MIEGFSERFLVDHYDELVTTPELHRLWWRDVTDPHPRVAIAGPRNHAKSTALNHCYGLAASLFRADPFQLKICKTYPLACEKVQQAAFELKTNERLRATFHVKQFLRDREDDIIVQMKDGYEFRIVAMGADQSKRGMSFGTIRPTLIQFDDIEDAKEVLNRDVRDSTMRWVLRTVIPMGARRVKVRWYGTIMHADSALSRVMKMPSWKATRYEACDEAISTKSILWPERFSADDLKRIRSEFMESEEGYGLLGFNMEYRNIALDEGTSFFRISDFHPMGEDDHRRIKTFYVGGDLAYSKKDGRDYSVFVVGGLDNEGIMHIVDVRRGRWDGKEVIDEMYAIDEAWHPEEWFIESGAIKETLGAALEIRMAEEGYLNIHPGLVPTKDKAIRAVPIQARMRSRGIKFDTTSDWFPAFKSELLEFTQEGTRGKHDDQVDALAWLGQGIKRMAAPPTEQEANVIDLAIARRLAAKAKNQGDELLGSYEFHRGQL